MTTEARKMEIVTEKAGQTEFNLLQKWVLLRSHPRRIFLDVAAVMWEAYFLWNQNWRAALSIFVAMNTVGLILGRRTNYEELSKTTLGKIALLHLQPVNFLVQVAGAILTVTGLWGQDTLTILTGLTLVYVGHFYGWSQVHPALKMRD